MTQTPARASSDERTPARRRLEHGVEALLFASRWLLAPIYVGMVIALVVIVVEFVQELWHLVTHVIDASGDDLILSILALIDLGLLANLVLIVVLAGYENFVSKIASARGNEDRPTWMGHIDFSGLKMKLIGSIVAISAIGLLQDFTRISDDGFEWHELMWRIMLHVTFLLSGIAFAFMDWLGEKRLILTKDSHSED